jgi:AbrB family looped-hinge helix DNA binding protein
MAKVTSKLQVTVPKALAEQYGIRPGDEIAWVPADAAIRLVPSRGRPTRASVQERLALFDQATERLRRRQRQGRLRRSQPASRGWRREDLYDRGRAR